MWKLHDLERAVTCESKVRWLSRVTPSVVMVFDIETVVPATLIETAGTKDLARCGVVNQMASDLSGFNDRPFKQNQWWIADRQLSSWFIGVILEVEGMEMNS